MPSVLGTRILGPRVRYPLVTANRVVPREFSAASKSEARPPSRAQSMQQAKQAVGAIDRRRVRFQDALGDASDDVQRNVIKMLQQKKEYDEISRHYLSKTKIQAKIDSIDAYAMSDQDKADNFKKCFMKFAGVFGKFLKISSSSSSGEKSLLQTELPREMETAVQSREGSTLLSSGKGKVRWALVALSTMAGTKNLVHGNVSSIRKELEMQDNDALKAIERLDVNDVDKRLMTLAGLYMDVREASVPGIGMDADSKNGPQLRYERWMRDRFSSGYFTNFLANYAGIKVEAKIRAMVEIFMMETLYIVYTTILGGVHSVSEMKGEHGSLENLIHDVRRQIRLLFNSALERMEERVSNSKYYRNMFFMCAAASAALVGIFIAIPNPPSLVGAITFIGGYASDSAAKYADNILGRATDANTSPIIERISRFAVSAEFSEMFKLMIDDFVYAASMKNALINKDRWQHGGASADSIRIAHTMLAATMILSALLA